MELFAFLSPQLIGGSVAALIINLLVAKFFPQEAKLSVGKSSCSAASGDSRHENVQGVLIVGMNSGKKNIENREVVVWTKSGEIVGNKLSLPSIEDWDYKLDTARKKLTFTINCLKPKEGFAITLDIAGGSVDVVEIDSRSDLKVTDGTPAGIDFRTRFKIFRSIISCTTIIQGLLLLNAGVKAAEQIQIHPDAIYVSFFLFIFGTICYLTGTTLIVLELPWKAMKEALFAESAEIKRLRRGKAPQVENKATQDEELYVLPSENL